MFEFLVSQFTLKMRKSHKKLALAYAMQIWYVIHIHMHKQMHENIPRLICLIVEVGPFLWPLCQWMYSQVPQTTSSSQ